MLHDTECLWIDARVAAKAIAFARLLAAASVLAATPAARALCMPSPVDGTWHNVEGAQHVSSVMINIGCSEGHDCDTNGNCHPTGSVSSMRVYGACWDSQCDWGVARLYDMNDGWRRAVYSLGYATSVVWIRSYQYYGLDYLRVWTADYMGTNTTNPDYTTDSWMLQ